MLFHSPLQGYRWFLTATGTRIRHYPERIPSTGRCSIVSNHRSFIDPLVLMAAIERSIHFACHYFMTQVPLLREMIRSLGCLPLKRARNGRSHKFFPQAQQRLSAQA